MAVALERLTMASVPASIRSARLRLPARAPGQRLHIVRQEGETNPPAPARRWQPSVDLTRGATAPLRRAAIREVSGEVPDNDRLGATLFCDSGERNRPREPPSARVRSVATSTWPRPHQPGASSTSSTPGGTPDLGPAALPPTRSRNCTPWLCPTPVSRLKRHRRRADSCRTRWESHQVARQERRTSHASRGSQFSTAAVTCSRTSCCFVARNRRRHATCPPARRRLA